MSDLLSLEGSKRRVVEVKERPAQVGTTMSPRTRMEGTQARTHPLHSFAGGQQIVLHSLENFSFSITLAGKLRFHF